MSVFLDLRLAFERRELGRVEGDPHMRAPAGPVEEGDLAHMLLDDLLDDREPQASAADPRRHVWLGQPLAIFGKADARVEHVDDEMFILLVHAQLYAIAGEAMLAAILASFNGFNAVLHDICKCLGELAPVA